MQSEDEEEDMKAAEDIIKNRKIQMKDYFLERRK